LKRINNEQELAKQTPNHAVTTKLKLAALEAHAGITNVAQHFTELCFETVSIGREMAGMNGTSR